MTHVELFLMLSVLEEVLLAETNPMLSLQGHVNLHFARIGSDEEGWEENLALTVTFPFHKETLFIDADDIDKSEPLSLVDDVLKLLHANELVRKQLNPAEDSFAKERNATMYRGRSARFDAWLDGITAVPPLEALPDVQLVGFS